MKRFMRGKVVRKPKVLGTFPQDINSQNKQWDLSHCLSQWSGSLSRDGPPNRALADRLAVVFIGRGERVGLPLVERLRRRPWNKTFPSRQSPASCPAPASFMIYVWSGQLASCSSLSSESYEYVRMKKTQGPKAKLSASSSEQMLPSITLVLSFSYTNVKGCDLFSSSAVLGWT